MYSLVIYDSEGKEFVAGGVKIGQFEMKEDQRRAAIPQQFDNLELSSSPWARTTATTRH